MVVTLFSALIIAVLGKQHRAFKRAFEGAQKHLRSKFGMEMVELPQREKATLKAKRGKS
jgi:hypothetical protein